MTEAIVNVGDDFGVSLKYNKGLNFWHYALKQSQETQTYFVSKFPEIFAYMIKMDMTVELNVVIDIFEKMTLNLGQ